MNGKNENIISSVFRGLFYLWFIASIGELLYLSTRKDALDWVLIIFGQYFLVFGGVGIGSYIKKPNFPFILILFPLAGGTLLGSGVYRLVSTEKQIEWFTSAVIPYIMIAAFPIIGVLLLLTASQSYFRAKKNCTLSLQAKCINIETDTSEDDGDETEVYMPVYEVYYKGTTYHLHSNQCTNLSRWEVGQYYTIKVNPNDINEFIDDSMGQINLVVLFFGVAMILAGIIAFALMLS